MVRFLLILLALLRMTQSAVAEIDLQDKLCILNAAPQLPAIAGMSIIATRVRPTAPKHRTIEFDIKAAGVDATISFDCDLDNNRTRAFPLGITK